MHAIDYLLTSPVQLNTWVNLCDSPPNPMPTHRCPSIERDAEAIHKMLAHISYERATLKHTPPANAWWKHWPPYVSELDASFVEFFTVLKVASPAHLADFRAALATFTDLNLGCQTRP